MKINHNIPTRCACGKTYRGRGAWNVEASGGVIRGIKCPRCQSPAENAEAEINGATLHYWRSDDGRLRVAMR